MSRMFILTLVLLAAVSAAAAAAANAATVEGTLTVAASDTGFLPTRDKLTLRVMGTNISSSFSDTGADDVYEFSLANVPEGEITLYLDDAGDFYTQESKLTTIDVYGNTSGISLTQPVPHYSEINYPPFVGDSQYVWQPQFIDENRGWIIARYISSSDSSDKRVQAWRTTDGGASWQMRSEWIFDDAAWGEDPNYRFPDHNIFHFTSEFHGIILNKLYCVPCGECGYAFLHTTDGGNSWSTSTALARPGSSYNVNFEGRKTISSNSSGLMVAAGGTGCGVDGYNSGFYSCVWESRDWGGTWELVWDEQDAPLATGLGVNAGGDAIVCMTPYNGDHRYLFRDGSAGTWDGTASTTLDVVTDAGTVAAALDVNSGHGPADIPMVGDKAWLYADKYSASGFGETLYRSDNAGVTWNKVSNTAPQYMDFVDENLAFALFGGTAQVTGDGGKTWLKQDSGFGLCCGGNDLWTKAPTDVVWNENGRVFTYADPPVSALEILPGAVIAASAAARGDANVPMISMDVHNRGTYETTLGSMTLVTSGTGDDNRDIGLVKLWIDADGDGLAESGDTLLDSASFDADNGQLSLDAGSTAVSLYVPLHLLITADFSPTAEVGGYYTFGVAAADFHATANGQAITATAPTGMGIAGRTMLLGDALFEENFESGLGSWTADTGPEPWQPWKIETGESVSGQKAVRVWADRNYNNYGTVNNLTLNKKLDLSEYSYCGLVLQSNHYFEQRIQGRVQVSTDSGSSWQDIGVFDGDNASGSTGGDFVEYTYDLGGFCGQSDVRIRFQADWSSGWYHYHSWHIDDVRLIVPAELRAQLPFGAIELLLLD